MDTIIIWVTDWKFADTLDEIFGKDSNVSTDFLDQLDLIEDIKEYCIKVNEWAVKNNLPIRFKDVRVQEENNVGTQFEWQIEFLNPTGRLLRTVRKNL
jgi:hypothetical protein